MTYETKFNAIKVQNCVFNVLGGFGAACIGCASKNTMIDIENCKFYKDSPYGEGEESGNPVNYRRLQLLNVAENCVVNFNNSFANSISSMISLADAWNGASSSMVYFNDCNLYAYAGIYNTINAVFSNCLITIGTDSNSLIKSDSYYSVNTNIKNSTINGNINIKNFNLLLENSKCNQKVIVNPISNEINFKSINSSLKNMEFNITSDILLKELLLINNSIEKVVDLSATETTIVNFDNFAISSTYWNNYNITDKTLFLNNII